MLKGIEDGGTGKLPKNYLPTQVVLQVPCSSRVNGSFIYWTEETEQALEELEGGKEMP